MQCYKRFAEVQILMYVSVSDEDNYHSHQCCQRQNSGDFQTYIQSLPLGDRKVSRDLSHKNFDESISGQPEYAMTCN